MSARIRIGLEIHVYLRTDSKLFCACKRAFLDAPPNTLVCPTCTGQPGAKPWAPNEAALKSAVRVAHALGAELKPGFRFMRKHYFYPDSPANYQRTGEPLATGGHLGGARLTEMHLEEDPGAFELREGVVDHNRSGSPLLEIVTDPDYASPEEARAALDELRLAVSYLGIGDPALGMKADANVSVPGGVRVEVKNVSGARNVERALAHEITRHTEALARGETIVMETRHFDETSGTTVRLRAKEDAIDYRFMPDPDLPWCEVPRALAKAAAREEPPFARRARLAASAAARPSEMTPIFEDRYLVDAFELAVQRAPPDFILNYFTRDLRAELAYRGVGFLDARITAKEVGDLIVALHSGHITPHQGTSLLRATLDGGDFVARFAEEASSRTDGADVTDAAAEVIAENPKALRDHAAGKSGVTNFLVGQVMRKLKGRGDVAAIRAAVEEGLAKTHD